MADDEAANRNYAFAMRAHDNEDKFYYQVNQAAIDTGTAAVKTFFMLNGGASIALLAFLGAVAGPGRVTEESFRLIADTLAWFAGGVALAAACGGAGYLCNFFTVYASRSRKRTLVWPYFEEGRLVWRILRTTFMVASVVAGVLSLVAFGGGMWEVRQAFQAVKFVERVK